MMMRFDTLETLAHLQHEMAAAQRKTEEQAIGDALACLAKELNKAEQGTYTTGEAAERLGVSIPTVKRWIQRGVLRGADMGTRWVVAKEGVDRIVRLRATLNEMDKEGNPTAEEFMELRHRGRRQADKEQVA